MGTIQQRDTARNCTKRSRLALSLVCATDTTNMKLIFIVVIIYIVVPFMLGSWLRATQYTNYYYQNYYYYRNAETFQTTCPGLLRLLLGHATYTTSVL